MPTFRSLGCLPNVACYLQNIYQSAQTERQKNKLGKSAPKVNKVNGGGEQEEREGEHEAGLRERESRTNLEARKMSGRRF